MQVQNQCFYLYLSQGTIFQTCKILAGCLRQERNVEMDVRWGRWENLLSWLSRAKKCELAVPHEATYITSASRPHKVAFIFTSASGLHLVIKWGQRKSISFRGENDLKDSEQLAQSRSLLNSSNQTYSSGYQLLCARDFTGFPPSTEQHDCKLFGRTPNRARNYIWFHWLHILEACFLLKCSINDTMYPWGDSS